MPVFGFSYASGHGHHEISKQVIEMDERHTNYPYQLLMRVIRY